MSEETKKCKHCKMDIPKGAKVCPHCRKKQGGIGKWIAIIVAALVIISVIGSFGSSEDDVKKVENTTQDTNQDTTNTTVESESETEEDTILTVGETGEYRDVRVTLNSITESNGSTYNTPADGNVFILAEFTIENNTDSDLAISSALCFDAYQDGYATNYSLSALIEAPGEQLDGTIAPGKKMKGYVGFEIPENYSTFEINFSPSLWSNKKFSFIYEK